MKVLYSPLDEIDALDNGYNGSWFKNKLFLLPALFALIGGLGFLLQLNRLEGLNYFREESHPHESLKDLLNSTTRQRASFQSWEKPELFNISNFRWLRNNASLCNVDPAHANARVVPVLVHTARSHFSERLTIRKSWGSLLLYRNWSIRPVFLIGEADMTRKSLQSSAQVALQDAQLNEEQLNFGDLVQGNFVDSYRNLTYKHLMGYKWILNFCPNASFVFKTDDDMFLDLMRLLTWRDDDALQTLSEHYSPPDLYCSDYVGTKPQRCVGCKWFTSEAEWPLEFYPDYCSGSCYGITVKLIKKLYAVTERVPFFWIDDVYMTGMLLEEVRRRNPDYEPQYRHLWGEVRMLDFRNFRPMCERHDLRMKRKFGVIVPVPRGMNFERDMTCLWNKTLYDDDESTKSRSLHHKKSRNIIPG